LAALSPSPFCPGYIINTSGFDFRKGQPSSIGITAPGTDFFGQRSD
jgi:hypothetical protein